jgi:hypothetical protein
MITVKVTAACGNHWITGINLTLQGAKDYFMGQRFTTMNLDESESLMGPVVSVELVE